MQRPRSIAHQYLQAKSKQTYSTNSTNPTPNNNMNAANATTPTESNWKVKDDGLRDVPNFYPLDKSSKYISDKASRIASRISECCRVMSVQAAFDDDLATADLKTAEHVEIHISLWKSPPTQDSPVITIVEAQRRNGDAVSYHKYCSNILSAADGTFCSQAYLQADQQEQVKMERRSCILQGIKNERSRRKLEDTGKADEDDGKQHDGNNIQHPSHNSNLGSGGGGGGTPFLVEAEDSLLALEIAASLLKKDRMDARQLGVETLCLLTDPIKAGMQTALLASKVVLFGSVDAGNELLDDDYIPSEDLGIREAILSLVQFGKLGEYADFDEEEDDQVANINPEDKEFNALLHNLALAVLANALDVLEQHGDQMASIGINDTSTAATATAATISASQNNNEEGEGGDGTTTVSTFLDESQEISKKELLSTLLNVLGKAESKPHDAHLSAQCLKSLFQASRRAKRRARDLNAKQIVNTALEVGRRTHVKLETETKKIMRELEKTDDLDDNNNERNNNGNDDDEDSDDEDIQRRD